MLQSWILCSLTKFLSHIGELLWQWSALPYAVLFGPEVVQMHISTTQWQSHYQSMSHCGRRHHMGESCLRMGMFRTQDMQLASWKLQRVADEAPASLRSNNMPNKAVTACCKQFYKGHDITLVLSWQPGHSMQPSKSSLWKAMEGHCTARYANNMYIYYTTFTQNAAW